MIILSVLSGLVGINDFSSERLDIIVLLVSGVLISLGIFKKIILEKLYFENSISVGVYKNEKFQWVFTKMRKEEQKDV